MSVIKRLTIFSFVLLLASCTTIQNVQLKQVDVAQGVNLALTPPPSSLIGQHLEQVLTLSFQQEQHQLLMQVQFEQQRIDMVAINVQGIPLFELVMQGKKDLALKSYVDIASLKPEYILADMQMSHWPIGTLNQHLSAGQIRQRIEGQTEFRELVVDNNVIVRIEKQQGSIEFVHYQRGYTLSIEGVTQ